MISKLKSLLKSTLGTSKSGGEFVLHKNNYGFVTAESEIVHQIAERAAVSVRGVRDAILFVETGDRYFPVSIRVTVTMEQGYSAPTISEKVTEKINEVLNHTLQLGKIPVDVGISEVAKTAIEKRKRVR